MFEERLSPAKVSAAAAAKLPRWLLVGLLAAYIVPGLFGRDPWTLKDAASFGVMWTMAQGTAADWWLPNIAGAANFEVGPLGSWVGAWMIQAFGTWLGGPTAARLSIVVWFVISTAALWYAVFRLARRDEAQPVAFAFGGEASPRDYGRANGFTGTFLIEPKPMEPMYRQYDADAQTVIGFLREHGAFARLQRTAQRMPRGETSTHFRGALGEPGGERLLRRRAGVDSHGEEVGVCDAVDCIGQQCKGGLRRHFPEEAANLLRAQAFNLG